MGPLLTLGGTTGKRGKVRQTGLSVGNKVIAHERVKGERQLRMIARGVEDYRDRVSRDGDWIVIRTPLPSTPFKPLFAYMALVKMAVALLPVEDLEHYKDLVHLLRDRDAQAPMGAFVGISFGSIGNAPPVVAASLLQLADATSSHLALKAPPQRRWRDNLIPSSPLGRQRGRQQPTPRHSNVGAAKLAGRDLAAISLNPTSNHVRAAVGRTRKRYSALQHSQQCGVAVTKGMRKRERTHDASQCGHRSGHMACRNENGLHPGEMQPVDFPRFIWSAWRDSNSRPLAPHASALPGCATRREAADYNRCDPAARPRGQAPARRRHQ